MPNFTHFQYVAYRTPTLRSHAAAAYKPDTQSKVGQGLDPAAQALVQRFAAVLTRAKGLGTIDARATTLKVFVAPEFYFKGPDPNEVAPYGSFSINSMTNILEALKGIGAPGPDWIVFAGSVVFYLPEKLPAYKHADGSPLSDKESVYANVAPVITQGALTYVLKHEVSSIDGPPPSRAASKSDIYRPLVDNWTEQKARFITVGNRTIGLEVCLDHHTSELGRAINAYPANESGRAPPAIDIHLVTACGMSLKTPKSRDNGYVLLCDGIRWGTDYGSQANKVLNSGCADWLRPQIDVLPASLTVVNPQTAPQQSIAVYPAQPLP
ncbi:MAG TPA: hypothetical protein VKB34_18090 [Povalibacter sp.]|nr:hypothetical protein [Povalibacter sp.]